MWTSGARTVQEVVELALLHATLEPIEALGPAARFRWRASIRAHRRGIAARRSRIWKAALA